MTYSSVPSQLPTGAMSSSKATGEKIPHGYKKGTLQQFTPEQMQLFQQLFGHVGPESFLSKLAGGDPEQFAALEAPALRQFNQLQGGIASKFSGMGMGGRRSSGFQNTMSSAAQDFAQQLQSQRLGLQNQAIQDLMNLSTNLLGQKPYENFLIQKQKKKPLWESILGMVSPAGGDIASGDTQNTAQFLQMLMALA